MTNKQNIIHANEHKHDGNFRKHSRVCERVVCFIWNGVGLVIGALAPLPIGRKNVRFCRPTLELIFLQHGRLQSRFEHNHITRALHPWFAIHLDWNV
jgi:hypothetical protein